MAPSHAANASPSGVATSKSDQTAAVLGCGAIGLAVIQLLRARGVESIYASDISETRRRKALEFGASCAFDPREKDVLGEVRKLTNGAGSSIVFECAGVPASMQTAIDLLKIHGSIIGVAL
ncbi:uncharacterized protein LTR77_000899 [Saxophila tyrrhenica]|uniref:Alcohol dehydrogenase-like C-terminal domain-containing protein n=1 Tax=Saxophila tyrrhenica TaxID=1690608 RepID=A0AAV9PNX3_9PEZI|nr:hypothetical protein LTR77_000899 [Saxophila tyrrhenica]